MVKLGKKEFTFKVFVMIERVMKCKRRKIVSDKKLLGPKLAKE
jgi:hypothetical protein